MEEEYKLNIQFKSPESETKIADKEKEINKFQVKKRMQSLIRNKPMLESTNSLINQKLNKKNSKSKLNNDKQETKDDGIITTRITPFSEEEQTKVETKEEKALTEGMSDINLNEDEEKPQETNEKVKIEFDNKENVEKESKVVLKFENEEALHSKENLNINFDETENNGDDEDDKVNLFFNFLFFIYYFLFFISYFLFFIFTISFISFSFSFSLYYYYCCCFYYYYYYYYLYFIMI